MTTKATPWVKYEQIDAQRGRFVAAPLKRGMGITLGNSLRRVLLSSLSGYAITAIKIEGAEHEFTTLPNVVEDVLDIICNLKKIVFKLHTEEAKEVSIKFKGKGNVTANDIELDDEVEIINKDTHIAELSASGKLEMTLRVEQGVGYSPSENHNVEDQDIHTICIDASFSPILRVNHQVEDTRVGKELDYDSLVLDVWTNGAATPEDAVKEAASILQQKFELFQHLNEEPIDENADAEDGADGEGGKTLMNLSIDDLELSARSSNCLKRAGIETVSELVDKDMSELTQIKNFGKKSADEINDKLKQYGLCLKEA